MPFHVISREINFRLVVMESRVITWNGSKPGTWFHGISRSMERDISHMEPITTGKTGWHRCLTLLFRCLPFPPSSRGLFCCLHCLRSLSNFSFFTSRDSFLSMFFFSVSPCFIQCARSQWCPFPPISRQVSPSSRSHFCCFAFLFLPISALISSGLARQ